MSDIDAPRTAIKDLVRSTYDEISPDFDRTRRRPWPPVAEFIAEIPKGCHVLDIGCGNGKDALAVLEHGCPCVCVDISKEQCRTARDKLARHAKAAAGAFPSFEVIQADCEDLPFQDRTFDSVLFIATLHHVPGRSGRMKALAEMRRVMRPGAPGLISVWDIAQERFKDERARQEAGGRPVPPGTESGDVMVPWRTGKRTYPRFYHLFALDELEALLGDAGFMEVRTFTHRDNHYARVIR